MVKNLNVDIGPAGIILLYKAYDFNSCSTSTTTATGNRFFSWDAYTSHAKVLVQWCVAFLGC